MAKSRVAGTGGATIKRELKRNLNGFDWKFFLNVFDRIWVKLNGFGWI